MVKLYLLDFIRLKFEIIVKIMKVLVNIYMVLFGLFMVFFLWWVVGNLVFSIVKVFFKIEELVGGFFIIVLFRICVIIDFIVLGFFWGVNLKLKKWFLNVNKGMLC